MLTRPLAALLGLSIVGPVLLTAARPRQQAAGAAPAAEQSAPQEGTPGFTLHAESRIVLADVTVTDRHGNAVHGLAARDFEVFDNDQPERIASFEEHDGATSQPAYAPPAAASNTASNNFQNLPPVLNVLLIDTTNLELPDQMYLRIQLTKFLAKLPANQPLAVFDRHGDYTVLLQPFTADRALLQAAVNRALPRIPLGGREYRSESATMLQIGAYLAQAPGRKNILWFSGGSTAYLLYGLTALTAPTPSGPAPNSAVAAASQAVSSPSTNFEASSLGEGEDELRQVYDELEAARIAIYPIDARGLTTEGDVAMAPQQSQMVETAEATGGEAFFNNNGLAAVAAHVVSTDSSSYSLTWSPQNFHYDGKWHTIRIVARNHDYHLSYRRGYFADKAHAVDSGSHKHAALFAGEGSSITAPDLRSTPLIFEANVHPAAAGPAAGDGFVPLRPAATARKGTAAFAVDYSLSTTALSSAPVDGTSRATVVFAIIALDGDGNRVGQAFDRVRFPLSPDGPPRRLQVEQQIDLPKGGDYLSLAVWDLASGHLGTLQIPVSVGVKTH